MMTRPLDWSYILVISITTGRCIAKGGIPDFDGFWQVARWPGNRSCRRYGKCHSGNESVVFYCLVGTALYGLERGL